MSISSAEFEPPPAYQLTPSRRLRVTLLLLPVLAATGLLVTTGLPDMLRLTGLVLTLVASAVAMRWHWPDAQRAAVAFRLEPDKRCRIRSADGSEAVVRIVDRLILPSLVILSLRGSAGRRALVVPSDALDAESHRRLRREARAC